MADLLKVRPSRFAPAVVRFPETSVIADVEPVVRVEENDGVRELVIVSQDTTYYGIDRYGQPRLAALLRQLNQVEQLDWIRLMYLYPENLSDELIGTIASSERIIPYLDMPLQHINDRVLRRMQRRVGRAETLELLSRLRSSIPDLVLRTTLITGFPGETDAEADELVDFVREQRFERLGVFTFSSEPDTPAARLPNHLPDQIKQQRRDRLMTEQQKIAFDWNDAQIGGKIDVLLDVAAENGETSPGADDEVAHGEVAAWIGRSWADAPDIDGVVYVTGSGLRPGKMVRCEVVARQDYDLIAVACP